MKYLLDDKPRRNRIIDLLEDGLSRIKTLQDVSHPAMMSTVVTVL